VADCLGDAFPEVKSRAEYVSTVIEAEEASFGRTLDRGIEIFNEAAEKARQSTHKTISGDDAFQLYDTYGFPLDLTQLMAEELGLEVNTDRFNELMEQQRERARAAQASSVMKVNPGVMLPQSDDSPKYQTETLETRVAGWIRGGELMKTGTISCKDAREESVGLILNETCFYAEAGGQTGDCGMIESAGGQFVVETTGKAGDCVIHWGKLASGEISAGDTVTARVDKNRQATRRNHTATHLLQWSLRRVLGSSVAQQGSLVCPDYLRFDFTYPKALTGEQVRQVEHLVREKINADIPVTTTIMPTEQARKLGAMALFGEKYGSAVRVVGIGTNDAEHIDEAFSKELCGGTHVERLGSIGGFKIIKEESISAGVRRITALTGTALADYLEQRSDIVDELSVVLKVPAEGLAGRIEQLIEDNKKLTRQLKAAAKSGGSDVMAEARGLLEHSEKIGETHVIIGRLSTESVEQGRAAIDMLRKKAKSAAVVLGLAAEDKATLLAGVTDDLIEKGVKAGDIVKAIAPIVEGGGGGRPNMAQAGGKKPEKIDDALAKAAELIKEKLS